MFRKYINTKKLIEILNEIANRLRWLKLKKIIFIINAVFNQHSSTLPVQISTHANTILSRLFTRTHYPSPIVSHLAKFSEARPQSIVLDWNGFPKRLCKMASSDLWTDATPCFSVAKSLRRDWPRSRHFQFASGNLCDLCFPKLPSSIKKLSYVKVTDKLQFLLRLQSTRISVLSEHDKSWSLDPIIHIREHVFLHYKRHLKHKCYYLNYW